MYPDFIFSPNISDSINWFNSGDIEIKTIIKRLVFIGFPIKNQTSWQ